jgi:hypothetical protein
MARCETASGFQSCFFGKPKKIALITPLKYLLSISQTTEKTKELIYE